MGRSTKDTKGAKDRAVDCPNCGQAWSVVRRSAHGGKEVVRRRHCTGCGLEFETVEQVRAVVERQVFQAVLFRVMASGSGE